MDHGSWLSVIGLSADMVGVSLIAVEWFLFRDSTPFTFTVEAISDTEEDVKKRTDKEVWKKTLKGGNAIDLWSAE